MATEFTNRLLCGVGFARALACVGAAGRGMKATDHIQATFRRQLEERRQEIAGLERLAKSLHQQQTKLDTEQKTAEAAGSAPHYIAAMAERRARIVQSLAEIDVKIQQARDGLSEAYHGVRRSEIAASARAEQNRRRHAG